MDDMKDTDQLIKYGVHRITGKLMFIEDVPNGIKCDCICINCDSPLEARNKGLIREHSFAHYTELKAHHDRVSEEAVTVCKPNKETILHRAAKQVLEESIGQEIQLPAEGFNTVRGKYWIKNARKAIITDIKIEKQSGHVIPDITLYTNTDEKIFFEIYVTHAITDEKMERLRSERVPTIEVDLSDISIENGIPWDDLRRLLLTKNDKRKLKYSPLLDDLIRKSKSFRCITKPFDKPWSDPCLLLPKDKQDQRYRCRYCPFFAGEVPQKDYTTIRVYCSADQLLNMNDITMNEADVAVLVEQKRAEYIKDHYRFVEEKRIF